MQPNQTILPFSKFNRLFYSLLQGCTIGFTNILIIVSFAALIYSSDLEIYFSLGFKLILLGSAIVTTIIALFSSLSIAIGSAQYHALPIYAMITSTIVTSLTAQHHAQENFSTVFFSIALATIITSLSFLIIGYLKLSNMISFIPYPVIGGFLAGIGWLLFFETFDVLIPGFDHSLITLLAPSHFWLWAPSVFFAIILLIISKKTEHPLVLPICLILGFILFFSFAFISQIPLQTLRDEGFIFNISKVRALLDPPTFSFQLIDWKAIATQMSKIAIIPLLCITANLLYETGLEVTLKTEINFNHELTITGWANLLAGLVGGIPGFTSVTFTKFNQELQKTEATNSRLPGVFAGVICLLPLLFGSSFLAYFPKFIFGGLLMFFGLALLKHWAIEIRKSLPLMEYLLILFILFVIAFFGILQGILIGILYIFSVIIFIAKHSRINMISSELKGDSLRSKKQRDPDTQELLISHSKCLFYFQLQNYLFFGNANILLQRLRELIATTQIHYLIYDFQHVGELDSSATMIFEKIKILAINNRVMVILTGMKKHVLSLFNENHFILEKDSFFLYFATMDEAIECCEETIISENAYKPLSAITLEEILTEFTNNKNIINDFNIKEFFEKVTIKKGDYLFKQNDHSTEVYFIESGFITIEIETTDHQIVRVRTIGPGNLFGEMSLYITQTRCASAIAEEKSVLLKISKEKIHEMETKYPDLAIIFHKYIINILEERVTYGNKQQ